MASVGCGAGSFHQPNPRAALSPGIAELNQQGMCVGEAGTRTPGFLCHLTFRKVTMGNVPTGNRPGVLDGEV